jgi:hypothetical protein
VKAQQTNPYSRPTKLLEPFYRSTDTRNVKRPPHQPRSLIQRPPSAPAPRSWQRQRAWPDLGAAMLLCRPSHKKPPQCVANTQTRHSTPQSQHHRFQNPKCLLYVDDAGFRVQLERAPHPFHLCSHRKASSPPKIRFRRVCRIAICAA